MDFIFKQIKHLPADRAHPSTGRAASSARGEKAVGKPWEGSGQAWLAQKCV